MGAGQSRSAEYESAAALFTAQEQEQILRIFNSINSVGDNRGSFEKTQLQKYMGKYLSEDLAGNLFQYMISQNPQQGKPRGAVTVGEEAFLVTVAHLLKGSADERTKVVYCLSQTNSTVNCTTLTKFIKDITRSFQITLKEDDELKSWAVDMKETHVDKLSQAMLQDMTDQGVESPDDSISEGKLESWLSQNALLLHMMNKVFSACLPVKYLGGAGLSPMNNPLCPQCLGVNWHKMTTLLDLPSLLYINHHVPMEFRSPWELLFSTQIHGESFSTMLGHIVDKGPSLLVMRDMDGHIFGGFASQSWTARPQFVGSSQCFLFMVAPKLVVYQPTGYNENYMYLNHGQETMPNGLGMGGQLDYFGLWIDWEYGTGHSKAEPRCTTFNSPQLSAKQNFEIDALEVWRVGPEPKKEGEEDDDEPTHRSVLDSNLEAKAMLKIMGRGPVSEGLRESDPTCGSPEEHDPPVFS